MYTKFNVSWPLLRRSLIDRSIFSATQAGRTKAASQNKELLSLEDIFFHRDGKQKVRLELKQNIFVNMFWNKTCQNNSKHLQTH